MLKISTSTIINYSGCYEILVKRMKHFSDGEIVTESLEAVGDVAFP
jgi:hypothetical protein